MIEFCIIHHFYPHTLTPTLTTETPINRAFQAKSEGVRVKKEKKFFLFYTIGRLMPLIFW